MRGEESRQTARINLFPGEGGFVKGIWGILTAANMSELSREERIALSEFVEYLVSVEESNRT
jgi:hypothetical protein